MPSKVPGAIEEKESPDSERNLHPGSPHRLPPVLESTPVAESTAKAHLEALHRSACRIQCQTHSTI